jgi:Protein of unknown function (DUF3047)
MSDPRHLMLNMRACLRFILLATTAIACAPSIAEAQTTSKELQLDFKKWQILERDSGPVNYYSLVSDPEMPYIRAHYKPPTETAILAFQVADSDRSRARGIRWKWRVQNLPPGGDDCVGGKGDSAAGVYLVWKRGMRVYTLKYAWSTVGKKGAICARKRTAFVARDKIIYVSGGPTNTWRSEELDLKAEFRKYFEDGDANADVPDFMGVGIMTDGDDTKSEVVADYADFVLLR